MAQSEQLTRARVHAQKELDATDELGNPVPGGGEWATQFTASIGLYPANGGENVIAARLQGTQLFDADMRQASASRLMTTSWRLVDVHDETVIFNIREIVDPTGRREWLRLRLERGVAT